MQQLKGNWVVPTSLMTLILGFTLVAAWKMPKPQGFAPYSSRLLDSSGGPPLDVMQTLFEREQEIQNLRQQVTELQTALGEQSSQSQLLNQQLQDLKVLAGLVEVEGPGIEVVLQDSKNPPNDPILQPEYVIHEVDILRVVNELFMSGAEAVAVGKQRVVATTYYRCEGPVVNVKGVPISSPVVIQAIGDPDTLYGALTMPGRVVYQIRENDPQMAVVRKVERLVLPAYTGTTKLQYAKPVLPDKDEKEEKREGRSR